jgi:hypothetical protein
MNINELLIQYLTTGDYPIGFRMQMEIPEYYQHKIDICSAYLQTNGISNMEIAKELVSKLFINL